jgi:hypothetical protein
MAQATGDMDGLAIIVIGVFEIAGACLIARLWTRRKMRILPRLFWSLVLLVPFFGLLMYGFTKVDPEVHPYDTDTFSGGTGTGGSGGDAGGFDGGQH